jgi:hypothetical protein
MVMTKRPLFTAATVFALGVIAIIAMSMIGTSRGNLLTVRRDLAAAQIEHAYLCGFRAGQIAITSRLPSLFSHPEDKADAPMSDECRRLKESALKNGLRP